MLIKDDNDDVKNVCEFHESFDVGRKTQFAVRNVVLSVIGLFGGGFEGKEDEGYEEEKERKENVKEYAKRNV